MSRNDKMMVIINGSTVAPRERRVSRNFSEEERENGVFVAPRERRVSRNAEVVAVAVVEGGRASREACE